MHSNHGLVIHHLSHHHLSHHHLAHHHLANVFADDAPHSVATPTPLTSKQEAKLRAFLDSALEHITRGYRKRFHPSSSLHTLSSYLAEWNRLLGVLAHVPPYGSGSTNLLISYLLRCSTDLSDAVTGYSLAMDAEPSYRLKRRQKCHQPMHVHGDNVQSHSHSHSHSHSDSDVQHKTQHQAASSAKQLNLALQTLDLLDRIWTAVLRANLINLPVAVTNSRLAFPDSTSTHIAPGHYASAAHGAQSHHPHHHPTSASPTHTPRESLPIHGGRAHLTVGVTDQVGLRNIAISSRDKLFSWMRTQLDAPAPPIMDEHPPEHEPRDNTMQGALAANLDPQTKTTAAADAPEEEQDAEFQDVAIRHHHIHDDGYDAQNDTEQHPHYNHLFERNLDPDADDDHDQDQADANMSRSEVGSIDLSLSHAIAQWDIAFTRLFSRTLRTLSDLAENAKRADKSKSTTLTTTHHSTA